MMCLCALTFTACSGDDGDSGSNANNGNNNSGSDNNNGTNTTTSTFKGAKAVFGNNLVKEIREVDEDGSYESWTFTYDANGYVTEVQSGEDGVNDIKVALTYGNSPSATRYDEKGNPTARFPFYVSSNGFLSKWEFVDDKGNAEYVNYTYNSDGQIKTIAWGDKNGIDETLTLTYQDGDIVKVVVTDDDGESESWDIFYSTATQQPILNTAGVMEFDHSLGIDMDDASIIYCLGALGKGTKHLPLTYTQRHDNSTKTVTNEWKLDSSGRVVQLTYKSLRKYSDGYEYTSTKNYYWKW